uniref:coiled-coil alpha-helical rod protein 1-like n=1 Tax=Styela clava TaxID=7725 RepID=UPI00193A1AF9|nr:coiled-coil alpha-helical rod protein 1-like [Styela clava]
MDKRLIPPSHFDPNEKDSLENTPSVSAQQDDFTLSSTSVNSNRQSGISGENFQLRPPHDFSSPTTKPMSNIPPFIQVGKRLDPSKNAQSFIPGHYQTPPQISRNQAFSMLPSQSESMQILQQHSSEKYSELLRLQAENEALKSVLQCKKSRITEKENTAPGSCDNNAHQAVIEHQTQHISRLQKDIDNQKEIIAKRENEVSQYQVAITTKEKENKELQSSMELLESQIERKNEKEKNYHEEIESLQTTVEELKAEKDKMSKSHSSEIEALRQEFDEAKQMNASNSTSKLEELSRKYEADKLVLERKMEELKVQHVKKIETIESCHQDEITQLNNNLTEKVNSHNNIVEALNQDIERLKKSCEDMNKSLENKISENQNLEIDLNNVQHTLEASEKTCEKHQEKVNQLQVYIGQQQSEDYERSQWKNHKNQYENNIVALQSEKESLNKTLELQNVRLQSITKILTTQEEAIQANAKSFSSGNIKGNPEHVVIRRWREKVFELMVQLKSNEISTKNIQNKYTLAEKDLEEKLEEEQRVSVILENQLCECKAQLEMQERENSSLSGSNHHLTEKLKETEQTIAQLEESLVSMSENVAKSTGNLSQEFQTKFSSLSEKTIHLEQRIMFASNRLRTVQDLMLRKDNIWRAKLKQIREDHESVQKEEGILTQAERPDLVAEISQLTKERDTLSQRLSSDSASFEAAMTNFRQRESELEQNVTTLQHDVQQKSEEIAECKIQIESMEDRLKDYERIASDARDSEKAAKENCAEDIEKKLEEAWKTWDAEKRELEKRLEESQREHARTVVTSRQSERNAVREKKRAAENLQAVVEECRQETEKLQTRVKSLKMDNNLLMATLRQQGLLSTFKEARAQARKLDIDTSVNKPKLKSTDGTSIGKVVEPCTTSSATQSVPAKPASSNTDSTENVNDCTAEMLKDLVVMTENILDDSD